MGIHYDYKSTRGDKAMKKEAKRKARIEQRRAKRSSANPKEPKQETIVLSAADPLNLLGIITRHDRVPSGPTHRIALVDGRPAAALQANEVRILDQQLTAGQQAQVSNALRRDITRTDHHRRRQIAAAIQGIR